MTENENNTAQEAAPAEAELFIPVGEKVSPEDFAKYLSDFGEQPFLGDAEVDGDLNVVVDANGDLLAQFSKTGRFRKYAHPSVHPGN